MQNYCFEMFLWGITEMNISCSSLRISAMTNGLGYLFNIFYIVKLRKLLSLGQKYVLALKTAENAKDLIIVSLSS